MAMQKKLRLFYADDEPDIREIATFALQLSGFEVTACDDGLALLALLEKDLPDVVLLDVMMPGLDGLQTFKKIRSNTNWEKVPCLFLTARPQGMQTSVLLCDEAVGIIEKPFDPMTLGDQVARELEKIEASRIK